MLTWWAVVQAANTSATPNANINAAKTNRGAIAGTPLIFRSSTRSDLTLIAWLVSTAVWTTLSVAGHDDRYDNNDRVYAHGVPPLGLIITPARRVRFATELQTSCPMVVDGFRCRLAVPAQPVIDRGVFCRA